MESKGVVTEDWHEKSIRRRRYYNVYKIMSLNIIHDFSVCRFPSIFLVNNSWSEMNNKILRIVGSIKPLKCILIPLFLRALQLRLPSCISGCNIVLHMKAQICSTASSTEHLLLTLWISFQIENKIFRWCVLFYFFFF